MRASVDNQTKFVFPQVYRRCLAPGIGRIYRQLLERHGFKLYYIIIQKFQKTVERMGIAAHSLRGFLICSLDSEQSLSRGDLERRASVFDEFDSLDHSHSRYADGANASFAITIVEKRSQPFGKLQILKLRANTIVFELPERFKNEAHTIVRNIQRIEICRNRQSIDLVIGSTVKQATVQKPCLT
jgi:hypothetical protein